MKAKLIFKTMTGHSRKVAHAIAGELKIEAVDIKSNPKLENVDLLYIVSGIYGGQSHIELMNYIKNIDDSMVKKVVFITSCTSGITKQSMAREAFENNNIEVLPEEYICKGNFLFFGLGHPSKTEIEKAVTFAKEVYQKLSIN